MHKEIPREQLQEALEPLRPKLEELHAWHKKLWQWLELSGTNKKHEWPGFYSKEFEALRNSFSTGVQETLRRSNCFACVSARLVFSVLDALQLDCTYSIRLNAYCDYCPLYQAASEYMRGNDSLDPERCLCGLNGIFMAGNGIAGVIADLDWEDVITRVVAELGTHG